MAKALLGHLTIPADGSALAGENARLRRRVADLTALVEHLQEENDRLTALHSADLDAELASELAARTR